MLSWIERLRNRRASLIMPAVAVALALLCGLAGELGIDIAASPSSGSDNAASTAASANTSNAASAAYGEGAANAIGSNAGATEPAGAARTTSAADGEGPDDSAGNAGADSATASAASSGDAAGEEGALDYYAIAMDALDASLNGATERFNAEIAGFFDESDSAGTATARGRAKAYDTAFANKAIGVRGKDAQLEATAEIQPASSRYTVMVYMVGSNLESQNAAATDDLREMLSAQLDPSQANLIVYAGGAKRWNSNIPAGHNNVLDLSRLEGERVVAQTAAEVSMGAPETLAAFINFCADHYPADNAALVFWDHGGGPLWGFGNDELAAGDSLLLSEMREAMEATPYKTGSKRKLDIVGFDACLMGSMENAMLWSDYARYLVASEEVEPGAGWNYSFLSKLNETTDARAIGKTILRSYRAYYEEHANTVSNPDLTLSLLDLSKAPQALGALDELFAALEDGIQNGEYAQVNRARRKAKAFGLSAAGSRAEGYDLVDVADFANAMADLHPQQAADAKDAIAKLAEEQYANVGNASGISMYLPGDNRELYDSYEAFEPLSAVRASVDGAERAAARGGLSRAYDGFVDAYAREWFAASEVDWTLAEAESTEEGIVLKLTDEQAETLSRADYTVMMQEEGSSSTEILTADVAIAPDDQHVLRVPANPELIVMKTSDESLMPGFFVQVADEGGNKRYVDNYLFLTAMGNFDSVSLSRDPHVMASVTVDAAGKVTTESFTLCDETVGTGGKNDIDLSEYSMLTQIYYRNGYPEPTFDGNGNVLPWREWRGGGSGSFRKFDLDGDLRFAVARASECRKKARYSAQIVVTDVNGMQHAVAPATLQVPENEKAPRETVVETRLGTLTFEVSDDHAMLSDYEGADWTIEIPTTVDGVPVTTIGARAFMGASYLDELVVPEGVTSIGAGAFSYSKLYKLTLPATLEHIGIAAFAAMGDMREFVVERGCKAASARDGVLFSADGKKLIAYPQAKGATYAVPQGVETIGYGAFARSDIERVDMPEGVRRIEPTAFLNCEHLTSIELPESLETIGAAAFGRSLMTIGEAVLPRIDRVHIGRNVREIGAYAFLGIALGAIDVDERNEAYSSKGGVLLNAAGDTLIEAPRGISGVVEVPEGIVALSDYAFADYDARSEFLLPTSLARCAESSFPHLYERDEATGKSASANVCRIHAEKGSYAARFAAEHGFDFDHNTDKGLLSYDSVTQRQGDYVLLFRTYADRAVLTAVDDGSAEGEGESGHKLKVPAEVSGKPVAEIDLGRDMIREGRTGYLSGDDVSSVETLVLPSSLNAVQPGSLWRFNRLKRIEVEAGSEDFRSIDGVLFSADGTVLVAYPGSKSVAGDGKQDVRDGAKSGDSANSVDAADATSDQPRKLAAGAYEVPDGVEEIAEQAFRYAGGLTSVAFPESLETVGAQAFQGCANLSHVAFSSGLETIGDNAFESCTSLVIDAPLPEGLEVIGDNAFFRCAGYAGLALPESLEAIGSAAFDPELKSAKDELWPLEQGVLAIGPRLKRIALKGGSGFYDGAAFAGLDVKGFAVDPENEAFRAEGPFLLDASGAQVVSFASGHEGEARMPDGVRAFDARLLASAPRLTDLVIPPSVVRIDGDEFETGGSAGLLSSVRVHVKAGSYAERFARERGLAWHVE